MRLLSQPLGSLMARPMPSGSALKKEASTRQTDMHAPEGNVAKYHFTVRYHAPSTQVTFY